MKYDKNEHKLITESERDRSELLNFEVDQWTGEEHRWDVEVSSIIELTPEDDVDDLDKPRFFQLNWQRGLTEMQENSFYDDEINEVFPTEEFEINVNHVNYLTYSQLNANNNKFSDIIDSLKVVGRPDGIKKISKIEDSEINQVEKILNKFELLDELSDDLKSEHKVALDYLNNVKVLKNKIQHELI
jgi:hypothetical protein